jgi:hypothetical protein
MQSYPIQTMATIQTYYHEHVLLVSFNQCLPRQRRQKCLLALLNVIARISNAAKEYLNDSSEHLQNKSASARNYRCSISPGGIRVSYLYLSQRKAWCKDSSMDMDKIT